MPVAYADAIRRAADLLIGENLTCPHVLCPGSATPVEHKGVAPRCESRDWRSRPPKKHTSKITKSCILHANEQKRSIFASPLYRGLCVGSDVTDGALLRGSSREPVSGAPPEIVCSRRAVDRAPRPKGGRGNRRDWAYCQRPFARSTRNIWQDCVRPPRRLTTIDKGRACPPRSRVPIWRDETRVAATSLSQPVLHLDTNQM
jgi:hypothetical protein